MKCDKHCYNYALWVATLFEEGQSTAINSLAPERFQRNFSKVNFPANFSDWKQSISCKIVLKWIPMDLTDCKSTLVQVMAWCRQATSHCLSQCWPRFMSPYGVTRPQWVKNQMWPQYVAYFKREYITQQYVLDGVVDFRSGVRHDHNHDHN